MSKMTITRALAEIKNIDSKIQNFVNSEYIGFKKKTQTHINGIEVKEKESDFQSNYDRITKLIDNRDKIKRAVILSNATTVINIGEKEMTIAEAIDLKNTIHNKVQFLNKMQIQYISNTKEVDNKNIQVEQDAQRIATENYGGKQKSDSADYQKFVDNHIDKNKYELVDPLKLKEKIIALEERISTFETEINFTLSESNARTEIKIDLS